MNHCVIDSRPSIRLQKREAFSSFVMLGSTALGGALGFKYCLGGDISPFIVIPSSIVIGAVTGFVAGPALAVAKEAVTDKIETTISNLRNKFHKSENESKLDLK